LQREIPKSPQRKELDNRCAARGTNGDRLCNRLRRFLAGAERWLDRNDRQHYHAFGIDNYAG
jgi:hypothetical protein